MSVFCTFLSRKLALMSAFDLQAFETDMALATLLCGRRKELIAMCRRHKITFELILNSVSFAFHGGFFR